MKKILVIGNSDSIFVKDFINQYHKMDYIVDLISFGNQSLLGSVRYQKKCTVNQPSLKIFNQIYIYRALTLAIKEMDDNYDCIIIHYVSFNLALHIHALKKISKKIVAVVWGSDFYRITSKIKIFLQNIIYNNVDNIIFTNPVTKDLFSINKPFILKNKLSIARFGLPALDEIDNLQKNISYYEWCLNFNIPLDKIKVMVGYNSNPAHNQLLVIDKLCELDKEIVNTIHLIFPLGYGNEISGDLIRKKLKNSGLKNYTILEKFYDFHEVAKLRCITDILINIQSTDQFSGSMQETLYAGGAIITGAWLPYDEIVNRGARIYLINELEAVGEKLNELIKEFDRNHNPNLEQVKTYINKASSWKENLKIWDSILFNKKTNNNFVE